MFTCFDTFYICICSPLQFEGGQFPSSRLPRCRSGVDAEMSHICSAYERLAELATVLSNLLTMISTQNMLPVTTTGKVAHWEVEFTLSIYNIHLADSF